MIAIEDIWQVERKSETNKNTILFVCVENAGRSQMAEGFFRRYSPKNYEPLSAGTSPASIVNPLAIEAMSEVGIDISKQRPKIITEDMIRQSTHRVNMGCMDKNFYTMYSGSIFKSSCQV